MNGLKRVTFLTLVISHYRVVVHEHIRRLLSEKGIEYQLVYSAPEGSDAQKGDTAVLPWAHEVPLKSFELAGRKVYFQKAVKAVKESDLVIVSQENKLLMNYYLFFRYLISGKKFAYFGHGKGFQSKSPNGVLELWKRFFAKRVHWWFAYTPGVAELVSSLGFPKERITTFNNSIDTVKLREEIESVTAKDIADFKRTHKIKGSNIGIYIGGMYEEKRLPFLCEAAIKIRKNIPDFELLLIGDGSHSNVAQEYASRHSFIHAPGPMFGKDRATALKFADVFLMPGLVGLAVIDSFIGECPIVTTNYRHHSPELEYLTSGENGLIAEDDGSHSTYADAVVTFLGDKKLRKKLAANCRASGQLYTAENMARNLAEGMQKAIDD